jgi:hypothetical protein
MLQMHCAVCCGFLSGLVLTSEVLRMWFSFEDCPNVLSIPYMSELFLDIIHIWAIYRIQRFNHITRKTAALPVNNWVNETSGITVQLQITSEASNYIIHILEFLAYGGSSFLWTLN